MSETPNPNPPAAAAPPPGKFEPITCAHVCKICGKPMRKNKSEYHGVVPAEMLVAIRKEFPKFHVKDGFCQECGDAWLKKVEPHTRKPAWMTRPLG